MLVGIGEVLLRKGRTLVHYEAVHGLGNGDVADYPQGKCACKCGYFLTSALCEYEQYKKQRYAEYYQSYSGNCQHFSQRKWKNSADKGYAVRYVGEYFRNVEVRKGTAETCDNVYDYH